jgi:hypothetical protein
LISLKNAGKIQGNRPALMPGWEASN